MCSVGTVMHAVHAQGWLPTQALRHCSNTFTAHMNVGSARCAVAHACHGACRHVHNTMSMPSTPSTCQTPACRFKRIKASFDI